MKKALKILKTSLVWFVVIFAVLMMLFTMLSVSLFNRSDRNLFGYQMYIVKTDSMAATDFAAGDLIFAKRVEDAKALQEGDIITFVSQNTASFGEILTHKIRKVTSDAEGNLGFVTYGTTTDTDDEAIVSANFVLGQYQGRIPGLGNFFHFMKSTTGYFVCIFIPFMLIILYEGIRFVGLFRRYKKEQLEEVQREREALQEQREANEKMLQELQELKSKLESGEKKEPQAKEKKEEAEQDEKKDV